MAAAADEIRAFLIENFLFGDAGAFPGAEDSLLDLGIIDSTGVLELVAFLEQRFEIKVEDAELVPENLDSLKQIAEYVDRKRAAHAG